MDIKGKVIIVTGASSGIGEAAARHLANLGAKVALVARSKGRLEALAEEIPGSAAFAADMSKPDDVRRMVKEVRERFGAIDVLVNNAGRGSDWDPVERISLDDFRDLMELNVYGPIVAMQEVVPIMRGQAAEPGPDGREGLRGIIVNIGSGTTKMPPALGMAVYPGTKVLLTHVSRVARAELAPEGIAVTVVHPYITRTNFFSNPERHGRSKASEALGGGDFEPVAADPDLLARADDPMQVAREIERAIRENPTEIDMSAVHRS